MKRFSIVKRFVPLVSQNVGVTLDFRTYLSTPVHRPDPSLCRLTEGSSGDPTVEDPLEWF